MPETSAESIKRPLITRLLRRRKTKDATALAGAASPAQQGMRLRVSEFENSRVRDVMVARAEIAAVEIGTLATQLHAIFLEQGHSRLPVYCGTLDDPAGFVHVKDFLATLAPPPAPGSTASGEPPSLRPLKNIVRPVLFVPESTRLPDLLVKMQSTRIHIALVIDEYGGTDGMVTLEDLVEQIVGDIEDEHDQDEALIVPRSRNVFDVDSRAGIPDLEKTLSLSLALPDYEDNVDTVGGLVFALAGRIPARGEIVSHPSGIDLKVIDADPRRIKRLRVQRTSSDKTTPPPPDNGNG